MDVKTAEQIAAMAEGESQDLMPYVIAMGLASIARSLERIADVVELGVPVRGPIVTKVDQP